MENIIILKDNEILKVIAENNPEATIFITSENGKLFIKNR